MNNLRKIRKSKNLTLRNVADDLNMSFSNIASLERGDSQLREDTAKLFAEYYDVSINYLLGKDDVNVNDVDVAFYNKHGIVTDDEKKLIQACLDLINNKKI